jgi:uncharacterized lipoprotein YddW (UPF0748 family)
MGCNNQTENTNAKTEKETTTFKIAVWGRYSKDKSRKEQLEHFIKLQKAGITDFFIGGDTSEIRELVNLTKDKGMHIHAWVWTLNRPGDTVAQHHPEWYAVNRKGQNSLAYNAYVNYYQWLSPFSIDAREYIKKNIESYAKIEGLASVHLDYVRFCDVILGKDLQPKYNLKQTTELPEYDYGYHPAARDSFKKLFGEDPMFMEHPELSHEWKQFRLNAVTSLVNELYQIAHKYNNKLSAAVFPFPEMSRQMVRQDWSNWNIDLVLPMVYQNFYQQNMNWIGFATKQGVNELKGRLPLYTGLYIPGLNPTQLEEAMTQSIQNGAQGVSLFDLGALTEAHLTVIKQFKAKKQYF